MRLAILVLPLALLGACSRAPAPPKPVETEVPEEFRRPPAAPPQTRAGTGVGTPLKERVATLGLLNKRNNIAQDLVMKPGETRRIGDVIVALKSCERTAPWELPQETGAFVQVFIQQSGGGGNGFAKVFSGWLFRESPSLTVVEHPIYDVWVKDCTMRFPGEEAGAAADKPAVKSPSRPRPATPSLPAPVPTPAPAQTSEPIA